MGFWILDNFIIALLDHAGLRLPDVLCLALHNSKFCLNCCISIQKVIQFAIKHLESLAVI